MQYTNSEVKVMIQARSNILEAAALLRQVEQGYGCQNIAHVMEGNARVLLLMIRAAETEAQKQDQLHSQE